MTTKKKTSILTLIKEYALVTLGMLLYVLAWTVFLMPNNLVGGGISGLSAMIQYATNGVLKSGYTYFVINVVLLIIGLFTLGKQFGIKTVYAIVITSVGLNVFQDLIPAEICQTLAVDNGKLISCMMGGALVGVGIGIAMSVGGSSGGTDIIALIVNKYRNVSVGKMILLMDVVIICSSIVMPSYTADGELLPFATKISNVVYGLLMVYLTSTCIDLYLSGARQSNQLLILSSRYEQIADMITHDMHREVTVLEGEGWFTKQPAKVLMCIVSKGESNVLLRYIKSVDSKAFVSVSTVGAVYGKGFEKIKGDSSSKPSGDNIGKDS